MSSELIAYLATFIPVAVKFLRSQTRIAEAAEHAIRQNTDLLARQTTTLEAVVAILNNLQERVDALETGEDDTVVVGFRPDDDAQEEETGEPGEGPLNVKPSRGKGQGKGRG